MKMTAIKYREFAEQCERLAEYAELKQTALCCSKSQRLGKSWRWRKKPPPNCPSFPLPSAAKCRPSQSASSALFPSGRFWPAPGIAPPDGGKARFWTRADGLASRGCPPACRRGNRCAQILFLDDFWASSDHLYRPASTADDSQQGAPKRSVFGVFSKTNFQTSGSLSRTCVLRGGIWASLMTASGYSLPGGRGPGS